MLYLREAGEQIYGLVPRCKTVTGKKHGSHIFGLTNFPDISSIFFPFSGIFSVFYLLNLTHTKIYLTNTLQLKSRKKNKNWLKFPPFSNIFLKFPDFSSLLKIPWLEKSFFIFPGFPVHVGTMKKKAMVSQVSSWFFEWKNGWQRVGVLNISWYFSGQKRLLLYPTKK